MTRQPTVFMSHRAQSKHPTSQQSHASSSWILLYLLLRLDPFVLLLHTPLLDHEDLQLPAVASYLQLHLPLLPVASSQLGVCIDQGGEVGISITSSLVAIGILLRCVWTDTPLPQMVLETADGDDRLALLGTEEGILRLK